jgi:aminodeoxyfutalosine deaminase
VSAEENIKALPKLEQHVHIVGSIKPETLVWLIKKSGSELPYETVEDLREFYRYRDFSHFIGIYSKVNDTITSESYFEKIAYEMLESQANCNVRHVEAIFSAWDHIRRGLDYGLMLDAINKGIRKAKRDFNISCTLRVDLVRNYGPEVGMKVLDLIEGKKDNIIAIDTGGSEYGYPPTPYRGCYSRAREMGLHTVAHQGEGAGADYVWECIEALKPERIGHGVAAGSDSTLIHTIAERGISIECCPVSNLMTAVVPTWSLHPIRKFIENGIRVSVNSDDPPMFGTDMNNEYLQLSRNMGFTLDELFRISLNSVETSFLPPEEKGRMRRRFEREYERI